MNKKINLYTFTGIVFTLIFGTLLHFVYDWSDSNPIIGIFSPVNESVWEHLKLLFYPMSLWQVFGYFKYKKQYSNYISASLIGLVIGMLFIPVLFYCYTFIIGNTILVIDIIIFIISTSIAFMTMLYILKNYNLQYLTLKSGIFLWELIFVLFVIFTVFPPDCSLFTSPK